MTVFMVPAKDERPWATLGPLVCRFIEDNLVHGPGDLRGEPARLDDEKRALIWRMYEVYPQGHALAGRRRHKRVALSLRKGVGKTELMAWIAACELHPEAPVRCVGWDKRGRPVGGPVTDPYIPMVAYTEEQSEELAYGTLRVVLAEGPLAEDFDIGLERIVRKRGDGKAVALASAPNARDGARTTFNCFDETHRMTLPNLKRAHQVMLANVAKRKEADGWSLEITTAPEPGGGSVAEDTWNFAKAVYEGHVQDARLLFFHRQAGDSHELTTEEGVRAAVIEASGPAAAWTDIDAILALWRDPTIDRSLFERLWTNRMVRASDRAFDVERWKAVAWPGYVIPQGATVALGFDGSRTRDATALVATEIATGFQQLVGLWEPAFGQREWEAPEDDVDAAVAQCFEHWNVARMYADPPFWQGWVSAWIGRYGDKRVAAFWTNKWQKMAYALQAFVEAIQSAAVSHDGDDRLARHVGQAYRRPLNQIDEKGQRLWIIQKERSDSPHKIDAAMAAVLSWQARLDAIAAGSTGESIYDKRGLIVL